MWMVKLFVGMNFIFFFPVSWPSCYFYVSYWWLHNQSFVYFPNFLGMTCLSNQTFPTVIHDGAFQVWPLKTWTYSTMVRAGNDKNPPNIWKLNVQWILMKKINRFNLLWWPAFTSLRMHLPPPPDFVPLGYLWKVLAFSPLGLSAQGITIRFLVGILVFQNNTGRARNYDSIA